MHSVVTTVFSLSLHVILPYHTVYSRCVLSRHGCSYAIQTCQNKKLLSTIIVIDGQQRLLQAGILATKVLWKATNAIATPYCHFLVPPTVSCFQCQPSVSANNPPTTVVLYSQDGPLSALVITL